MKIETYTTEDGYTVTKKSYTELFEERMREEARKDQRKTEPKPQKNRKKVD